MEKKILSKPLTKVQVVIMAIAAGVCVANVFTLLAFFIIVRPKITTARTNK